MHYNSLGGTRSIVTLGHVLQFVTGTDEELVPSFELHPTLLFHEVTVSFVLTANTCSNTLYLPHPTVNIPPPDNTALFGFYDYAFLNAYFGNV